MNRIEWMDHDGREGRNGLDRCWILMIKLWEEGGKEEGEEKGREGKWSE